MKIDFKNRTLKSTPATSCYACDEQVNYVKFYTIFQMFVFGMTLKTVPKVVYLTYENTICE